MQAHRRHREEGFSLIEVMVVVMVIGILISIGLPVFQGARNRATERAAQASLRTAVAAARVLFTDGSDYAGVTTASMTSTEPSLTYRSTGDSTGPTNVSLEVRTTVSSSDTVVFAAIAADGYCFYLRDTASTGTRFGKVASATSCDADSTGGVTFGPSW